MSKLSVAITIESLEMVNSARLRDLYSAGKITYYNPITLSYPHEVEQKLQLHEHIGVSRNRYSHTTIQPG